jgi:conjugative transposon TraK protein
MNPFPKAKNIETAFQLVRLFCFFVVAGSLGLSGFLCWQAFRTVARAQGKVYILACDQALEAVGADRKENVLVMAKGHVRSFHHLFFTMDPDEKVITTNITQALYLADGSAKRVYDDLKETGYYARIISGNISQKITIDSITVDMQVYPYYFRCYASQEIIRSTSIATRILVTEGWLRNTEQSDNNLFGFLIEKWNVLVNKDVKVVTR